MKQRFKGFFGKGSSVVRVTIMSIVMAAIVVSFYYSLSHRLSSTEELGGKGDSELDICLTQDFVQNYPASPRDVVKWYNRIITLFYAEKLKDSQIEALCDQTILLMDKELTAQNPRDVYIGSVKQEIERYANRKKKIIQSSIVSGSGDVKYVVKDGDDLAFVTSSYITMEASVTNVSYQTYCLRRDGSGKYKILTFKLSDENGN